LLLVSGGLQQVLDVGHDEEVGELELFEVVEAVHVFGTEVFEVCEELVVEGVGSLGQLGFEAG